MNLFHFFFLFNHTTTPFIYTLSLHHSLFFFLNDTAPTEIYPLSLHDALPISGRKQPRGSGSRGGGRCFPNPRSGKERHVRGRSRARPRPLPPSRSTRSSSYMPLFTGARKIGRAHV